MTAAAPLTAGAPRWAVEGRGWPHAEASRFVRAGGLEWHVQVAGQGPDLVLVHGLGGASHSWRGQIEPLSRQFRVIVPDLPGHGFTGRPAMNGLSLPGQSRLLAALLEILEVQPVLTVAHSAGAAILARMALDRRIAPRAIIAFNGAFLPFPGMAGQVFPQLARLMTLNPFVPRFFSLGAVMDPASIERLMIGIGSRLDPAGLAFYRRLLRCPGHVQNALSMMARWELQPLVDDLPALDTELVLATGSADRAVTPSDAESVAALVPMSRLLPLGGLGHLAHEEAPERANALILETARRLGALPANAA